MPGKSKKGGGLEVGSAYRMKNSMLHMSAKTGSPMQANYGSPMRSKNDPSEGTATTTKKKTFKETLIGKELSNISKSLQEDFSKFKKGFMSPNKNPHTGKPETRLAASIREASYPIMRAKNRLESEIRPRVRRTVEKVKSDVSKVVSKAKSSYADYKANKKEGESRFDYNIRKRKEKKAAEKSSVATKKKYKK